MRDARLPPPHKPRVTLRTQLHCADCDMVLNSEGYHPLAACIMYKACEDVKKVNRALDGVRMEGRSEGARTAADLALYVGGGRNKTREAILQAAEDFADWAE